MQGCANIIHWMFPATGNQGSIPDMSGDNALLDDTATTSSAQVAAGHAESSGAIAQRVAVWLTIREATMLPTMYVLCLLVKHTHI